MEQTRFGYSPGDKGFYVLLSIKGILMFAAIALMWSSNDILEGDNCELKEALDQISLNYAPFCEHTAITQKLDETFRLGIAVFCGHSIFSVAILSACLWPSENKRLGVLIISILVTIVGVAFLGLISKQYSNVKDVKNIPENKIDYNVLKSKMSQSLETNFKSDNTSSEDIISSEWNKFFITYNCCAVNDVPGTTNDFDTTPWCTTSGSCQSTASQIPKTCCVDVTVDDYQNAPASCHAFVNKGTYKAGCFDKMRSLSVVKNKEKQALIQCQEILLSFTLFTLVPMQVFEVVVAVVMTLFSIWDFVRFRKPYPSGI